MNWLQAQISIALFLVTCLLSFSSKFPCISLPFCVRSLNSVVNNIPKLFIHSYCSSFLLLAIKKLAKNLFNFNGETENYQASFAVVGPVSFSLQKAQEFQFTNALLKRLFFLSENVYFKQKLQSNVNTNDTNNNKVWWWQIWLEDICIVIT